MTISRRDMIQQTAAAAAAAAASLPLVKSLPPVPPLPPQAKFFTAAEFALVDELSDMIIPTDEKSAGARAAGVAAYIDARLAESFEKEPPEEFRSGLKAVEDLSRELNGKPFMQSTAEQRLAVLTKMAAGESDPKTPAEKFFRQIKGSTIQAYYSSKIGIHDDQNYKGNVYQTGDYAGFDAT
jgi:Gluconate 2-dehydrogenase subunit 3